MVRALSGPGAAAGYRRIGTGSSHGGGADEPFADRTRHARALRRAPDRRARSDVGDGLSKLMDGTLTAVWFDRTRLARAADLLAVAVLASIPWSTTATAILVVLWLVAFAPTLDWPALRRELRTPAGGLPVLFFLLAAGGMLWADAAWRERLGGLDSFHRLLVIPLLMAQFRRSGNGRWMMLGFLASCTVLLVASYAHYAWRHWVPDPARWTMYGVPVKDYILQSGEFQLCAFGLAYAAVEAWRAQRRRLACALGLLACAFLANIVYIVTGRTTIVVMPVLLALLGLRLFGWRGALGVVLAGVLIAAVGWYSSNYLRMRVLGAWNEAYRYETQSADTSAGQRLEFWKKSLRFIAAAPLIGHGTGSIREQFRGVVGTSGPSTIISENPHQQTLTVAIQLGLLGVIVLYAMWIAHLWLFRGGGLVGWCGLLVVAQNMVASLFNSYLFDFTQGWLYVFGVGTLGGAILSLRARESGRADEPSAAFSPPASGTARRSLR
jgi:O-antigen ligase